jgi:dGTPase
LEVAQVGRQIGQRLGADPDAVDTACLAHDLGHPPFGHNGERVLNEIAKDIGGFEGNAQTFRILTRLEPKVFLQTGSKRSIGLNLTRASLDAAVKYPWVSGFIPEGKPANKFGVYLDDVEIYNWVRKKVPANRKCLEAQVMDLADDISYSVHDVEDAIASGSVSMPSLKEKTALKRIFASMSDWAQASSPDEDALTKAYNRLLKDGFFDLEFHGSRLDFANLKRWTSSVIGRFSVACEAATREIFGDGALTRYSADLIVPEDIRAEIELFKSVAVSFVMLPREEIEGTKIERKII